MTWYVCGRTIEKLKLAEHLSMKRITALYVRLIKRNEHVLWEPNIKETGYLRMSYKYHQPEILIRERTCISAAMNRIRPLYLVQGTQLLMHHLMVQNWWKCIPLFICTGTFSYLIESRGRTIMQLFHRSTHVSFQDFSIWYRQNLQHHLALKKLHPEFSLAPTY